LWRQTVDRPGLLVDLVKNITEINVSVKSREFDTEVIIFHSLSAGFYFLFLLFLFLYCMLSILIYSLHFVFGTYDLLAKAKFHVSYRDKATGKSLQQVIQHSGNAKTLELFSKLSGEF
jgi:hypothetical protein